MTDLEITQLCAEAMCIQAHQRPIRGTIMRYWFMDENVQREYNPLHDDAQAMALVKKSRLDISAALSESGPWDVSGGDDTAWSGPYATVSNANLNRAICECVARLQLAKAKP